jgi:hypothetical protein
MAKKDEIMLPLAPSRSLPTVRVESSPTIVRPSSQLIKDERRIWEQVQQQTTLQQGQAQKTAFAMAKIGEIHHYGIVVFDQTAEAIESVRFDTKLTPNHQRYVDEFSHHTIQTCARHLSATMEIGSYSIAQIVHQSLDVPEEKRGLLQRLLSD